MSKQEIKNVPVAIFLFILVIASMVPAWIYSAFVITVLWGWFIVPVFGIGVPTIPLTMGVLLIISYFRRYNIAEKKYDTVEESMLALLGGMWLSPSLFYLLGYIIHSYV